MASPLISIVMPVRNGMPFLRDAVESILRQTFRHFEFVIVDDGSTDKSASFLESLTDPRLTVLRNDTSIGVAASLNRGIAESCGGLIARMDADDISKPERLEKQVVYFSECPETVLLGTWAEEIDAEDAVIGERAFPISDAAIRWQLAFGCPFLHPSVMMRRSALGAVGGYGTEPTAQDYALWTRLVKAGKVANLGEKLIRYRVHAGAVTTNRVENQVMISAEVASRYAAERSGLDQQCLKALYLYLFDGRRQSSLERLAETYKVYREGFELRGDQNLDQWILQTQVRLRWHCLDAISLTQGPLNVIRILRQVRKFDPDGGTLLQIAGRVISKAFRADEAKDSL